MFTFFVLARKRTRQEEDNKKKTSKNNEIKFEIKKYCYFHYLFSANSCVAFEILISGFSARSADVVNGKKNVYLVFYVLYIYFLCVVPRLWCAWPFNFKENVKQISYKKWAVNALDLIWFFVIFFVYWKIFLSFKNLIPIICACMKTV